MPSEYLRGYAVSKQQLDDILDKMPGKPAKEVARSCGLSLQLIEAACLGYYKRPFSEMRQVHYQMYCRDIGRAKYKIRAPSPVLEVFKF